MLTSISQYITWIFAAKYRSYPTISRCTIRLAVHEKRCSYVGQLTKVHRYLAPPVSTIAASDSHCDHVNIGTAGPLNPPHGYASLLTCIDRFTRWPEAIPISSATAESAIRHFVEQRIALRGCPSNFRTDRGQQLSSIYFLSLGVRWVCSDPAGSLTVGRAFHCHLKETLKSHKNRNWYKVSPKLSSNGGERKWQKAEGLYRSGNRLAVCDLHCVLV